MWGVCMCGMCACVVCVGCVHVWGVCMCGVCACVCGKGNGDIHTTVDLSHGSYFIHRLD